MQELTPMMQQYMEIKQRVKDCILFFRLGDFYEMFFDDAIIASKELEIALTARDCGNNEKAPMCGVPYHSAHSYIAKLIEKGYKVAICEQVEDPKLAKGVVKREITRIITPGTFIDENFSKANNFICCVARVESDFALTFVDISTGEMYACLIENDIQKMINEISKYAPSEILISHLDNELYEVIRENYNSFVQRIEFIEIDRCYDLIDKQMQITNINDKVALSVGNLLNYLVDTQKISFNYIKKFEFYRVQNYLQIDLSTKRNLELTESIIARSKKNSLFGILDQAKTSMGSRLIKKWLERPLIDVVEINRRLDAVEELYNNFPLLMQIEGLLEGIYDIERLSSKFAYKSINAKDLLSLKKSIEVLPRLKELLGEFKSPLLKELYNELDTLEDVYSLIDSSINEDAPVGLKEGGIIKDGFNDHVDRLRNISKNSKELLIQYEEKERNLTGIKNLKIGYNKVFGYYIEVTKSNYSLVPERYIRKQTLANAERYVTEELKKLEDEIINAEQKLVELEYELFCQIRDKIESQIERIQKTASCIAIIDALCSFAHIAIDNRYTKPIVYLGDRIYIKNGRHPVVEKMIGYSNFVPNDTELDNDQNRVLIITGPNMAGKSTYMRQVALIVIMAQMGCFVPAEEAQIGIVDKIFSRIGASDDISSGQSTFMVEMSEVANILKNATPKSLIIFDEVGRGTSTYDGLSIAWAVLEFVADKSKIGAKTLFATHYHELTELEEKISGVKNYRVDVKEEGKNIIFLRKIVRGGCDSSYGIHVARLAGIPEEVLQRAEQILKKLEEADINRKEAKRLRKEIKREFTEQIEFFSYKKDEIIEKIENLDILNITPIQALNILSELKHEIIKAKERQLL
ncbi:DNA mismatch repair protein MutS [Caldicellulosiruptor saccharolyticus DSM 8903]|uniref:DNA mismatch repair protein MutS n=1 Tax=Caldicellulosiruptor saccharolyticus (strain ATCC 43494 / DSM 8903 / Tp8T 6331) TaxID=351627 RepID=MUTS_CALS8|nr:DNA mismatch repair protein MutS [Caldicellulosiruptor saccharolyticus]A4XL47.1 RecName: Full=DNA mismatch repair protein MutS [Caldicellulosiruptor saccharolyticus DSM 8903]ABP67632.1 DNA mismatch repair protein MutS [Caldicellulosiruptor saccharolyticus DSM 8903]